MKASGLLLSFDIFWWPSTFHTIREDCIKLYSTDPDVLIFKISEKGQGLVFLPYFENDFSRKTFHMLNFIN